MICPWCLTRLTPDQSCGNHQCYLWATPLGELTVPNDDGSFSLLITTETMEASEIACRTVIDRVIEEGTW